MSFRLKNLPPLNLNLGSATAKNPNSPTSPTEHPYKMEITKRQTMINSFSIRCSFTFSATKRSNANSTVFFHLCSILEPQTPMGGAGSHPEIKKNKEILNDE